MERGTADRFEVESLVGIEIEDQPIGLFNILDASGFNGFSAGSNFTGVFTGVLFLTAAVVAVCRFGPYSF